MDKRVNGRIEDVRQSHGFRSGEGLERPSRATAGSTTASCRDPSRRAERPLAHSRTGKMADPTSSGSGSTIHAGCDTRPGLRPAPVLWRRLADLRKVPAGVMAADSALSPTRSSARTGAARSGLISGLSFSAKDPVTDGDRPRRQMRRAAWSGYEGGGYCAIPCIRRCLSRSPIFRMHAAMIAHSGTARSTGLRSHDAAAPETGEARLLR